jgi:Family of unknown function (DUF6522)
MIGSRGDGSSRWEQRIEFRDDTFVVDAALVGELLHLPASRVQTLMRSGKITSACERGVDEHAGEFRLSFFYGNRRARVRTDLEGHILRRSAVDFGDRLVPTHRSDQPPGTRTRSTKSASEGSIAPRESLPTRPTRDRSVGKSRLRPGAHLYG